MRSAAHPLPEALQPLFWDQDFLALDWEKDRDFIVRRVTQSGDWAAIRWLRSTWGDEHLRSWLLAHSGGRLNPRQLRYWELILDLPAEAVNAWVARAANRPWGTRSNS